MDKKIYTRQELYELVWNEPLSKLAKKLNIETQYLKDICLESQHTIARLIGSDVPFILRKKPTILRQTK